VAINSYDNALLTLLLSNQFVEIKGSVFKKFERQNLFQIACAGTPSLPSYSLQLPDGTERIPSSGADIVERFQLGLMLGVIALRNLIEMSGSDFAFLPKSFIRGKGNFETILSVSPSSTLPHAGRKLNVLSSGPSDLQPALVVLGSEMAVDWVKHA
jgi:hypothetical protein